MLPHNVCCHRCRMNTCSSSKQQHDQSCRGHTLWLVGAPRLKSSLSMEGRSS
jgi:hypothetical protein